MNNTEQFRYECECKEWLRRIRQATTTYQQGKNMLDGIIADVTRIRGKVAADRLRDGINQLRGAA